MTLVPVSQIVHFVQSNLVKHLTLVPPVSIWSVRYALCHFIYGLATQYVSLLQVCVGVFVCLYVWVCAFVSVHVFSCLSDFL